MVAEKISNQWLWPRKIVHIFIFWLSWVIRFNIPLFSHKPNRLNAITISISLNNYELFIYEWLRPEKIIKKSKDLFRLSWAIYFNTTHLRLSFLSLIFSGTKQRIIVTIMSISQCNYKSFTYQWLGVKVYFGLILLWVLFFFLPFHFLTYQTEFNSNSQSFLCTIPKPKPTVLSIIWLIYDRYHWVN